MELRTIDSQRHWVSWLQHSPERRETRLLTTAECLPCITHPKNLHYYFIHIKNSLPVFKQWGFRLNSICLLPSTCECIGITKVVLGSSETQEPLIWLMVPYGGERATCLETSTPEGPPSRAAFPLQHFPPGLHVVMHMGHLSCVMTELDTGAVHPSNTHTI